MMEKRYFSSSMIILMFLASLTMMSVPVMPLDDDVTFDLQYYYPDGYVHGVDPGGYVIVDVFVDASALTNNSPEGMRGWGLKVTVDPDVLTPTGAAGGSAGYFLYDWSYANWPPPPFPPVMPYPPTFLSSNGTDYIECAENFLGLPPNMGAGGTGKLCTLYFLSKSKTDYSPITIVYEDSGYTEALAGDKYHINPIDGHYNQPPVYHTLAVESTPIDGINFTIDATTYTTNRSVALPEGNYTVTMPSTWMVGTDQYNFSHWEDNSTNAVRAIFLTSNMTITATYELELVPPATIALVSDHSELLAITPILDSMGIGYDVYNDNSIHLHTENLSLLLDYSVVIFYTGSRYITSNEYSVFESYLSSGGNLLVTGFDCLVGDSLLADLVRSSSYGDNVGEPDLYVVDATHPIMNGPYGSFSPGYHISGLYSDCDAAEADTARNALTVAELADGYDRIIATDEIPGKVVFWNGRGDQDWMLNMDCEAMFKNTVAWFTIRYEHELIVSLEAPDFLELGQSFLLNATVQNRGLNNETNVDLFLSIDGTAVSNVTIPELPAEESYTINYGWTPTVEATYNVTAYAPPVLDENVTANNIATKMVTVRSVRYILFDQTHGTDSITGYSVWVANLIERGYIVDTLTTSPITPSMLEGYNVLVIPQAHDYYSSDELLAIQDFVLNGGGLLVIGDDAPYIYTDLTGFAGISWTGGGTSGITTDITLHEVTEGVDSVHLDAPIAQMLVTTPALDLIRDPAGGIMLAVSEQVGRVIGFADEGSLWDYGIAQEDNLRLANNMIEWLLGVKYEHELVVRLEAPNSLEPGDSSLLNATVCNRGLGNETDVELFLLINGTIVSTATIPELLADSCHTLSYLWTPTNEGIYNVTAYAPPMSGENVTTNNHESRLVYVFEIVKAVVLDSCGTDYGYDAFWDYLNTNWAAYGSIPIVIDYTSLNKEDITLADIEATDADALIISNAWSDTYDIGWEFSDSEIEAIKTYVLSGHGIIATSGTFDTWSAPNNQKLAELFGMDLTIWYNWGFNGEEKSTSGTFELQTPRHNELWYNIPDPYLSGSLVTLNPTPTSDWAIQGVTTGWIEALSTDHYAAVITSEVYRAVYFTCILEFSGQYNENNRQLFYNAIVWAQFPLYEHDLAVSIEVPAFLEPGDSSLLNATVYNIGLSNETSVELQLLINGTVVDSVVISELESRSSYTLSYLWAPILEGIYNVTVHAVPVPDENITTNNVYSAFVTVRFKPRILAYVQYTDYWQEYANSLAAIDSTFGPAYVLTELLDYTQLDSMLPGNDVLFIPEQEYSYLSMMETIGEAWSETISNFLEEGGVIIVCDHSGGSHGILTGAGLMSISSVNSITGWTVYLVDPTDPLAKGVSSSFTAPNGALSFVTDETNVVFDDGTYPVVIHKKVGQGHIALIGFDYYASNPDTKQILGNALSLALYMRVSISPSAGSPGTEVTVTGTKAAATGAVEIYWDATFIGETTADAVGNFTYLLAVPLDATAGLHEIRAVDVATGETSSRTFRVIFITVNPISGPIGTKATVNGAGFSAYTQVPITFNNMQIGYAVTDDIGNFTFVFNIPLSEAGLHSIKAWQDLNFVETSFTVIDVTPLEIQMDVGAIFFKGETAEFYVQTCFNGVPIDATSINVTLCKPDGTIEVLVAQRIATGLHKIECLIKGKSSMVGTYMLIIEASYATSTVDATGTSIKTFLVKEPYTTLEKEAPKAAAMVASIGSILALAIVWRKRKQLKE